VWWLSSTRTLFSIAGVSWPAPGATCPPELAELCGDYVHMTTERRAVEARQKKHQEQ
jgi:hypothetical protein